MIVLATKSDYDDLKHFKMSEWNNDPLKVTRELIMTADAMREFVDRPCVINVAFAEFGHSIHSKHYRGMAMDFYFKDIDPIDAYHKIFEFLQRQKIMDKCGLGFYPHWNNIGFHLDIGARERYGKWAGININGENKYVALTAGIHLYKTAFMEKRVHKNENGSYIIK